MSRPITALFVFLIPVISQAAIVDQRSRLVHAGKPSCIGNLSVKALSMKPLAQTSARPHRYIQADIGAMLTMGYSYYAGLRPQRTVLASQALGLDKDNYRPYKISSVGYGLNSRPRDSQPVCSWSVRRDARKSGKTMHSIHSSSIRKALQ